jgi:hypothetical protein
MKCQKLERNGKIFWFFPDITIHDTTRGFLVDQSHMLLGNLQTLWEKYVHQIDDSEQCFSAFLYLTVENNQMHEALFTLYQAMPTSEVIVVGRSIPSYSKVVKKKRISAL